MPDDTQIDLAQVVAELRRELAAQAAERDAALAREAAMAEVLQVINSSPGDLAPVFNAMLDKALGLCGAAFGVLWTYDGEVGHAAAFCGVPPAFAEFFSTSPASGRRRHRQRPSAAWRTCGAHCRYHG